MSVCPPRGRGRVRLVEIAGVDLQACGGTHVRSTGEIGRAAVAMLASQIEGAEVAAEELFFDPELVARGSTEAAPVRASAAAGD